MGNTPIYLLLGIGWVVGWWKIFSKAGFPVMFSLLMVFPVVNVFVFLMFAFVDWPIHVELARLRNYCKDQEGIFPPESLLREADRESLSQWLANEPSAEEMFDKAAILDQRGDWADALTILDYVAEKFNDQPDGQYARNCAEEIHAKIEMGRDD